MVNDLKDLKAFLKLCREMGVDSIETSGVKVTLGSLPSKESRLKSAASKSTVDDTSFDPGPISNRIPVQVVADQIATEELSAEDLLFYSASDQQPS